MLPLRKFLRPVAISIAAAILTAHVAFIASYLLYPVSGIQVQGARLFPQSEAWEAIPNYASLLFLDAEVLERQLESNPWVEGVRVLKDWKSGIVMIEVEERRAVLNGDLGGRRIVLSADGTKLPGLGGADLEKVGLDEAQLEEISKVGEVLEENGLVLDSVDEVSAGGVEATVAGHRVLFARRVDEGQAQALTRFMDKYPEASYFDLRSSNRVVVGAESGEESAKKPKDLGG